ncbi:MAG TPA: GNAT family N-acetyltransferase [Bacillota bacterium]|nr:GNAT family N-acetyltransferase [Bacillota bacterium]
MTIRLEKMHAFDYQQYLNYAISNFANEQIRAGIWEAQEALYQATQLYKQLLPEGVTTEGHYLFTIRDSDQKVGIIWLAQRPDEKGFIYDINIWKDYRGKGYGKQAMKAIEIIAKQLGLTRLGLHVFGHNEIARNLYETLEYRETNIRMEKSLE